MAYARRGYVLLASISVIALLAAGTAFRAAENKPVTAGPKLSTEEPAPVVVDNSSPDALKNFPDAIAELLLDRRFNELDRMADRFRSQKERFPGGRWKLQYLYQGLANPAPGQHATDEDWNQHLKLINDWVAENPASITARVALAQSWIDYGWFARGDGYSDKVTNSGWRSFDERIAKAKEVLDEAAKLNAKCPHWYRSMMEVALVQGWDLDREDALLREATAFEPLYYAYYRAHAMYLAPRWHGEQGDMQRFAKQAADHIGGDEGEIVYFEMAAETTCTCNDPDAPIKTMDWQRIQRGYQAAEKKYGLSYHLLNQLALMASVVDDAVVADECFKRIGDNRASLIFENQRYFDSVKQWAAGFAPMQKSDRDGLKYGPENMKTPEGVQFRAEFEGMMAKKLPGCLSSVKDTPMDPFQVKLRLAADGTVNGGGSFRSEIAPLMQCVFQAFGSRKPFTTKPPKPDFWLLFDVDPTKFTSAVRPPSSNPGN
jgi:hypothetical protein